MTSTPLPAPTNASAAATASAAARAVDLTKVYGEGDTRVVALDSVSCGFERGHFTAIMGPSGSGKSTLMHCMAGLDTATSGSAFIGDVDLSTLDDKRLTRLRRDSLGFIFQAFNLVPTLTAIENITLPMDIAGRKPDQEWLDNVISTVGPRRPAQPPAERALRRPAAAGRRRPRAGRRGPRWSSPTSRPATSTPAPAPRSWASCGARCATWARRS